MTAFAEALKQRIRDEGPITVEAYMAACNAYYYATRDPLGVAGDFTTAPEIHQMFGEMIGACLADAWLRAGKPGEAVYAELGPGRGTLAADALRVLRRARFTGQVHLVETSTALRQAQSERVEGAIWHDTVADLPPAPLLLVANEFLDALPIRQWVGGKERRVALDGNNLRFTVDGPIREDSPARDEATAAVAAHLARHGGAALIVDYGHARTADGDTLQAVRAHQFAHPLGNPGEQDLTSHVDFEAVASTALAAGAKVAGPVEQGAWLQSLGIAARAAALAATNPARREEIDSALHRLTAPGQMGKLFKLLGLTSPQWPVPAGFGA